MLERAKHRVSVITLGCKLNFAESSAIVQTLQKYGFEQVPFGGETDLYIVNTCTVTEHSNKKCRNLIRRAHNINKQAKIIVTGCYAQLKEREIADIEGVTMVIPHSRKDEVVGAALNVMNVPNIDIKDGDVQKFDVFPAASFGERTRSFLKVQDGCDYFCTYCAIPFARGRSRAVPSDTIIEMAHRLAIKGVKEIVLTGVNLGDYTRVSDSVSLIELLKELNNIEGIERYRISSIEPNLLTEEIIDWIASGTKFAPHFHIPLQSGCNATLKRMKRRYDTSLFSSKINYIREKMGDVFFGIDVIVGFPGETEDEFRCTFDFLSEQIKPAFLHIFPFSPREGTIAYKMENQVPESLKQHRVNELEKLSQYLHKAYNQRFAGTMQEVLFESSPHVTGTQRIMEGYSGNYIRVCAPYDEKLIGKIVRVVI